MTLIERRRPRSTAASRHLAVEVEAGDTLRITGLRRVGRDENLLGEFPDIGWSTPWGTYDFVGGHRLWLAPERFPEVAEPEGPAEIVELARNHVRLEQRAPSRTGITRTIEVELDDDQPRAVVRHTLVNAGAEAIEAAPWALTMLPLGGTVTVRDDAAAAEPAHTPARRLVGWPYTSWHDPRLAIAGDLVSWRASPGPRFKLGIWSPRGSISYEREGVLLEKTIVCPHGHGALPDLGCNLEIYSDERFLEVETLGPLTLLRPGATASHVEEWRVDTVADGPGH